MTYALFGFVALIIVLIINYDVLFDRSPRQRVAKAYRTYLNASKPHGVPVVLMAGCIEDEDVLLGSGFRQAININAGKDYPQETAMKPEVAYQNLLEKSLSL